MDQGRLLHHAIPMTKQAARWHNPPPRRWGPPAILRPIPRLPLTRLIPETETEGYREQQGRMLTGGLHAATTARGRGRTHGKGAAPVRNSPRAAHNPHRPGRELLPSSPAELPGPAPRFPCWRMHKSLTATTPAQFLQPRRPSLPLSLSLRSLPPSSVRPPMYTLLKLGAG
jgi:hypothetical protein